MTFTWKVYAAAAVGPVMTAARSARLDAGMPSGEHLGAAVLNGFVFSTAGNRITKTNVATGETTVFAGTTAMGCVEGDTGATSTFSNPNVIGTDGSLIYVASAGACSDLRTVNPTTGATRSLPIASGFLNTVGGHYLYTLDNWWSLYQYNLQTGVSNVVVTNLPAGSAAIAADDTSVWVALDRKLMRFMPTETPGQAIIGPTGQVTTVTTAFPVALDGVMVSVGDYLYVKAPRPYLPEPQPIGTPQPPALAAVNKATGTYNYVRSESVTGSYGRPMDRVGCRPNI